MRLSWLASALLLIASPALAQSPPPSGTYGVYAPAAKPAGPQTVRGGATVLTLQLRSLKPVRLETAVDASAAKLKRSLPAGQVLFEAPNHPGVWCAPVHDTMLFSYGPCLVDADQDGRFEAGFNASFIAAGAEDLAITEKGWLYGVVFGKPLPLAQPASYNAADPAVSPPANGRLRIASTFNAKAPGPVSVAVWLEAGDESTGTKVVGPFATEPLEDGKAELVCAGVTVRVLGVDAKGLITYEIGDVGAGQTATFSYRAAPRTIVLVY